MVDDAWGVTNNFTIQRDAALQTLRHLAKGGKPIVVGGSDAIADPQIYLQAGAAAVVTDKSGAANWAVFDAVLGKDPREPLSGVIFADGKQYARRWPPLHPEEWALPSVEVVRSCAGSSVEGVNLQHLAPMGDVIYDIGCDRTCDFCQTPTYKLGYHRMSPQRALQWCDRLQEAGMKAMASNSDQFLGRVLFGESGRQEVLDIVNRIRERGLPISWPNGLELRKATLGHGQEKNPEDLLPDEELVKAVWGWEGQVGCFYAYIPAERPMKGKHAYKKLLPWQQHCEMLRAIVRAGVPSIRYGVIIGFPDDNVDSFLYLQQLVDS